MAGDTGSVRRPSVVFTPQTFKRFAELISRELGIKMSEQKIPLLQSRLHRRMRVLGLSTVEEYQQLLFDSKEGEAELTDFVNAVTTNKTDFLREPDHFDYLVRTVVPQEVSGASPHGRLSVWSAGCSTGEEPYTMAMYLAEAARTLPFQYSIFATDISTKVLRKAQHAVYPESTVHPVPMEWRKRYLLRHRDPAKPVVRVVPELRARVRFAQLNFMAEDYGMHEEFDVIFFRNVMIYFDRPTQERVVLGLCRSLRPGGYLFVGHSESLIGLSLPLKMVASAVYRRSGDDGHP